VGACKGSGPSLPLSSSVGSAQAANLVVSFTNWRVGGTLTLAKLQQNSELSAGSTFNGSANLFDYNGPLTLDHRLSVRRLHDDSAPTGCGVLGRRPVIAAPRPLHAGAHGGDRPGPRQRIDARQCDARWLPRPPVTVARAANEHRPLAQDA